MEESRIEALEQRIEQLESLLKQRPAGSLPLDSGVGAQSPGADVACRFVTDEKRIVDLIVSLVEERVHDMIDRSIHRIDLSFEKMSKAIIRQIDTQSGVRNERTVSKENSSEAHAPLNSKHSISAARKWHQCRSQMASVPLANGFLGMLGGSNANWRSTAVAEIDWMHLSTRYIAVRLPNRSFCEHKRALCDKRASETADPRLGPDSFAILKDFDSHLFIRLLRLASRLRLWKFRD
ncbi:MAG: hypothetical protein AAF550_11565 [Myxococcota bacterium]